MADHDFDCIQPRNGWFPYPIFAPAPGGDSRHLCVITEGDMHYVGIAAWVERIPGHPGWYQNGSPVQGSVWAFKRLDQGYPIPPNSAEGMNLGLHGVTREPLNDAARAALAKWWDESRPYLCADVYPVRTEGHRGRS